MQLRFGQQRFDYPEQSCLQQSIRLQFFRKRRKGTTALGGGALVALTVVNVIAGSTPGGLRESSDEDGERGNGEESEFREHG